MYGLRPADALILTKSYILEIAAFPDKYRGKRRFLHITNYILLFQFLEVIARGIVCHSKIEGEQPVPEPVSALLAFDTDEGKHGAVRWAGLGTDDLVGIEARGIEKVQQV